MIRVAVLCPSGPELTELYKALKVHQSFRLRSFMSLQEAAYGLRAFFPQTLILRLLRFDQASVGRIRKTRLSFPHASILVAASEIDKSARFALLSELRTAVIDVSRELHDIPELIHRFHKTQCPSARAHLRAGRSEAVELKTKSGQSIRGRFIDFGRMGARLQIDQGIIRPHERILLSYASSTGKGTRRVEAVVVWKNETGLRHQTMPNTSLLGLKFIAYA